MKSAAILALAAQVASAGETASPVAKVLDLLSGLEAKIISEGESDSAHGMYQWSAHSGSSLEE